jgi:RNA polymerase sigma factor (sigma-70 family)
VSDPLSRALADIVSRAAAAVRQAGWRYGLSPDEVDEVFQDVRIRLWNARSSEQISETSTSYVYKTAASAALDLIRRRRAGLPTESLDVVDAPAPGQDPERTLAATELGQAVNAAVDSIPATRRPVVRMYLMGYPREEIAQLMGWTEAKTRNLLYRGLADLREALTARGIGPRTV